jgi:hypothetical protein
MSIQYRICTRDESLLEDFVKTRVITFKKFGQLKNVDKYKDLELLPPDPRLLAIHAVCARVAHMSGAAEYMDKWDWAVEEMETLSTDGSSPPNLFETLNRITILSY